MTTARTVIATQRPYLDQAADFQSFLAQQREEAERARTDLANEIANFETEIRARMGHVAELDDIIARCAAALALALPAQTEQPQAPRLAPSADKEDAQ